MSLRTLPRAVSEVGTKAGAAGAVTAPTSATLPDMTVLAYARVSSGDQSLDPQRDTLTAAGAERIFHRPAVQSSAKDRPGLDALLGYARAGDTVVAVGALALTQTSSLEASSRTTVATSFGIRNQ